MNRTWTQLTFSIVVLTTLSLSDVDAQSFDTPMTRLRPIGSPSAVDQYRAADPVRQPSANAFRQTSYQSSSRPSTTNAFEGPAVRQTVMLQQFEAPQLPGGATPLPGNNFSVPGATPPPSLPPSTFTQPPRSLPGNSSGLQPVPMQSSGIPSSSDFAPLSQPQLGNQFATIDNCNCISGPSSYSAASGIGCGTPVSYNAPPGYAPQGYVPPPAQIAAPAILPTGFSPPQSSGAPFGSLISFGQQNNPVTVGQGIIGQPVAYVPGQPIRNFVRYIFP